MSIIEHVTLQKIVAHDFRYVPRINDSIKRDTVTCDASLSVIVQSNIVLAFLDRELNYVYAHSFTT